MNRRTFLSELDDLRAWSTRPMCDPAVVREWVEPLLARAYAVVPNTSIPLAGTEQWAALEHNDPRKLAAVAIAAIASLEESTPRAIAARIAAEWAASQREFRARLKEASADLAGAQDWGKVAGHVPFCVYAARRTTYATPARTPEEIREQARASWAAAEARSATADSAGKTRRAAA